MPTLWHVRQRAVRIGAMSCVKFTTRGLGGAGAGAGAGGAGAGGQGQVRGRASVAGRRRRRHCESGGMVSALLRRVSKAFGHSVREDELRNVFSARGAWLAVATRTTSVSDPDAAWWLAFVDVPEQERADRDGPAAT